MVPIEIEKEFMKGNKVYYIVLDKGYEKSPKMVTYCRGCEGKITIEDKKFPNNMVFRYRYCRKVPQDKEMKTWAMLKDRKNCYFHARDMGCLHQIEALANVETSDVFKWIKQALNSSNLKISKYFRGSITGMPLLKTAIGLVGMVIYNSFGNGYFEKLIVTFRLYYFQVY